MKLVGDIGGTKVLLALVDGAGRLGEKRRFASADYPRFDELLADYLGQVCLPIAGGCLAVAGPVSDDGRTARITNLPWRIDAGALEVRWGLGPLLLINDFAGVALGVAAAPPDSLLTLQAGSPVPQALKLVIGAGTGLGMAMLQAGRVLPSEGGHIGFAPQDEDQHRVWFALAREHGRVTAERVISGPGLAAIHHVLAGEWLAPELIGERALSGEPLARHSVDVFFAAYGAFAGDMAMATLARGGVFLAGGVTQKLLPLLTEGPFLQAFNAKAEHAGLVGGMAIRASTDPEVGLAGAVQRLRATG